MRQFWRKYHKWVGLFFTFFILMFCVSGIILNHRQYFADCDLSRNWMPEDYQYKNWNNSSVKGTFKLSPNKVLCYGNTGIWLTDSCFSIFQDFNKGLKKGADHRKISNITRTPDGKVWCAGLYDLYCLDSTVSWEQKSFTTEKERLADVTNKGDTLIVLTRSYIYEALPPYNTFTQHELKKPTDYSPEVSLFRTVWVLHSGELFGLPGQLFVDCIAIVIIILCVTGLIYTFLPYRMKRKGKRKENAKKEAKLLKFSVKWHNRLGKWMIVFTLLLAMTGMCLRPPLMIPLAMTKVNPIPGTTMAPENPWQNKFRGIRWDKHLEQWLIGSSSGFYALNDFDSEPVRKKDAPPISPMGLNVFLETPEGNWLVGSFSGLYEWNAVEDKVTDYFSGKAYTPHGYGGDEHAISGYSSDFALSKDMIFEYSKGAVCKDKTETKVMDMPEEIADQHISLWNVALELHVGRCYSPFLGPFSSLFVFFSGLLLSLILISGYLIRIRKTNGNKTGTKKGK